MNRDKTEYSNALQNLGNSHYAIAQQSIEGDDSKANVQAVAQTVTGDFGNMLLGHVATQSLSNLGKMGNQLSKLGINSEDAKILSKAIANNDSRKVGQMVARIGNDKVKAGIRKLTGKQLSDSEMPEAVEQQIDQNVSEAGRPIQVSQSSQSVAKVQGEQAGTELKSLTESEPIEASATAPSEASAPASVPSQYENAIQNSATETEGEVASVSSKVISSGDDVASGLESATLLSTSSDDTGVGLLVTAGLGIASLFTSLFMKKSKPKTINPPLIQPNNFAVQAGIS